VTPARIIGTLMLAGLAFAAAYGLTASGGEQPAPAQGAQKLSFAAPAVTVPAVADDRLPALARAPRAKRPRRSSPPPTAAAPAPAPAPAPTPAPAPAPTPAPPSGGGGGGGGGGIIEG